MIRDVTGTKLMPGNRGNDCLGNGAHYNKKGNLIECCCNECGYLACCTEEGYPEICEKCAEFYCPRIKNKFSAFFRYIYCIIVIVRESRKSHKKYRK